MQTTSLERMTSWRPQLFRRHKPNALQRVRAFVSTLGRTSRANTARKGAMAVGALALGTVAIGRLAVGRFALGRGRVRSLVIDDLQVGRLRVGDHDLYRERSLLRRLRRSDRQANR